MKFDTLRRTISRLSSGNYKSVPYVLARHTYAVLSNLFDLVFAVEVWYPRIQKPISRFQAFHFE